MPKKRIKGVTRGGTRDSDRTWGRQDFCDSKERRTENAHARKDSEVLPSVTKKRTYVWYQELSASFSVKRANQKDKLGPEFRKMGDRHQDKRGHIAHKLLQERIGCNKETHKQLPMAATQQKGEL